MSWEIGAGGDYESDGSDGEFRGSDDEDDWAKDDEETDRLWTKRLDELTRPALPQCGYNNCLRDFIRTLADEDVKFKVFGGAAYVHHACGDKSEETDATSPCRTHDVDLYLRDEVENKEKFEDALNLLREKYRFDELQMDDVVFEKHPTTLIKWKTKVDRDDDAVEHGIDVHYVGDEFEDSSGQKVRLWKDWGKIPKEHRHFITTERLCKTLGEMVRGGASSMDGENKGDRRKERHENLCARSTRATDARPTIDGGALVNPYGGAVPKRRWMGQERYRRSSQTHGGESDE